MLYDNALLLGVVHALVAADRRPAGRAGGRGDGGVAARPRCDSAEGGFAASLDADSARRGRPARRGGLLRLVTGTAGRGARRDGRRAGRPRSLAVTEAGTFEHGLSTLQRRTDADPERLGRDPIELRAARERRAPTRPGRQDRRRLERLADRLPGAGGHGVRPAGLGGDGGRGGGAAVASALGRRTGCAGRPATASSARRPGMLEDYAALALGFTRLAAATADPAWIERGRAAGRGDRGASSTTAQAASSTPPPTRRALYTAAARTRPTTPPPPA